MRKVKNHADDIDGQKKRKKQYPDPVWYGNSACSFQKKKKNHCDRKKEQWMIEKSGFEIKAEGTQPCPRHSAARAGKTGEGSCVAAGFYTCEMIEYPCEEGKAQHKKDGYEQPPFFVSVLIHCVPGKNASRALFL